MNKKGFKRTFNLLSKTFFIVWVITILLFFYGVSSSLDMSNLLFIDVILGILAFALGIIFWALDKANNKKLKKINSEKEQQKQPEKINSFSSANRILIILVILLVVLVGYLFFKNEKPKQISSRKTIEEWAQVGFDDMLAYCSRQTPYNNKPEFNRSISLILQRMAPELAEWEEGQTVNSDSPVGQLFGLKNCLDIQYASSANELGFAEGVFYFDNNVSGRDKLKILVSPTYRSQDDIITAYLLVHEIYHAIQFVTESSWGVVLEECYKNDTKDYCDGLANKIKGPDCIEKEANAFIIQLMFLGSLKPVEKNVLALRMDQEMARGSDSQLRNAMDILNYNSNLLNQGICNKDDVICLGENLVKRLQTDEYYRQQCGLD